MADLIKFIKSVKPSDEGFVPYAYYGEEEDAVKVFFKEGQDYAKRLNSRITIYLSVENDELIGVLVKNVAKVLEDIGSFDIGIEHKNVKLLFLAMRGEFDDDDSREVFRQIGSRFSESPELDLVLEPSIDH